MCHGSKRWQTSSSLLLERSSRLNQATQPAANKKAPPAITADGVIGRQIVSCLEVSLIDVKHRLSGVTLAAT
jgi:hypothetical protein